MKQRINVVDPITKERCVGVLTPDTGAVVLLKGLIYGVGYLASLGQINYFEKWDKGKEIKEKK